MNAVKELGKRLAARLDEDDWGYIEPFLNECETELESLRQQLAEVTNEKREYQLEAQGQIEFLDKKLAECQATNGKLRGWIEKWCKFDSLNMDLQEWFRFNAEYKALCDGANDTTALNELIAERTASLTAEVERLKDYWSAKNAQVDTLRQQNAELTAQRDAAISTIEFAYKVAVEHDDRIPFDWVAYCGMLHAAIINHKEQDENRSE